MEAYGTNQTMESYADTVEELITCAKKTAPPSELQRHPFIEAIWPWSGAARGRLLAKMSSIHSLVSPEAISQLENYLVKRWIHLCSPAISLELASDKLQGLLRGRSSKQRYNSFIVDRFSNPDGLRAFFKEYQELGRKVAVFLDQWEDCYLELLTRLKQDISLLSDSFNHGNPLGMLTSIQCGLGDPHQGGKSVALLTFEFGKKLFYKPRDLRGVSAFHALLFELNQLGLSPQLKGYQVLAREGYGWEEFVENLECMNLQAVSRYYKRAGMLSCLMYLLDGTDVHRQNLIANGEFPILIDLETLFRSSLDIPDFRTSLKLDNFVLKTGMFPVFLTHSPIEKGVDASGLGAEGRELITVYSWKKLGSDQIYLTEMSIRNEECKQTVRSNGKRISPEDYVEEILKGFNAMYHFIMKHRTYLLRENSPLAQMADIPVRIVFRSTRFYGWLLSSLRSGQLILNPHLTEKKLNHLCKHLIENGGERFLPILAEEKKALLDGDIPYFTSYPSQRHLYGKNNQLVLENALESASFHNVCERIRGMSKSDCELQQKYIRAAFFIKTGKQQSRKRFIQSNSVQRNQMNAEDTTAVVLDLAAQLKNRSFSLPNGGLNWIDLEYKPVSEQYNLGPISENLYGGRMGIALFFAALFHHCKDPQWRTCAVGTLAELNQKIDKIAKWIELVGIGGFTGVGGLIYGLVHCSRLLDENRYIEMAKKIAAGLEERHIQSDSVYDVVGGSAGLLLCLLQLHERSPDPFLIKLSSLCGDRLSECVKRMEVGQGWREGINANSQLGFAHGPAGIAYALLKLAHVTQAATYYEAANRAMEYERSFCNTEKNNWRSLVSKPDLFQVGWCYGAPGIGLGRLASLSFINDQRMKDEVAIAILTTEKHLQGFHGSPNLCCTHMGRLEFLMEAARRLEMPDLLERSQKMIPQLLEQVKNSNEFFVPGLMKGAAGIGYSLLRFQDKTGMIPPVLLLS